MNPYLCVVKKAWVYIMLPFLLGSCSIARHYRTVPLTQTPANLSDPVFDSIRPRWQPLARQLAVSSGGLIPSAGNQVHVFTNGQEKFGNLLEDLRQATFSIDVEVYRFADDSIATVVRDILLQKAAEGVIVRVVLEGRAYPSGKPEFYESLRQAPNIYTLDVQPSDDAGGLISHLNTWDHRKIIVIDNRIGYVGGMNIQDKYRSEWRDTHVRVEGPAARDMRRMFDSMWAMLSESEPARYPLPEAEPAPGGAVAQFVGDGPVTPDKPIQASYLTALALAQEYFYIQNPYFCPPASVIQALVDAKARGVDVRIMVPRNNDVFFMAWANSSHFRKLMKAGIRLYLRDDPFMHCKAFVADDYLSCVGSCNLDNRSLQLNFEDNLYMYDRELARQNKEIYMEDIRHSEELTLDSYKPSLGTAIMQKLTRLFSGII